MDSLTDAQLALLSQQGDRKAFGCLVRRWDDRLLRFLRRLLGNEEDARDVCQETMLRAFLNIKRLRDPAHFRAWVHQIAVNICRDRGRSPKYAAAEPLSTGTSGEPDGVEPVADRPGPHELAEWAGLGVVLERVLARLPAEQRTALLLKEIQGFTSEEIARIMDVPAATVRSRIFYGLRSLRRLLPEYGISGDYLSGGGTLT